MTAHAKLPVTSVRALSERGLQRRLLLQFLVITSTRSTIPSPRKAANQAADHKTPFFKFTFNKLGLGRASKGSVKKMGVGSVFPKHSL